MSDLEKLESMMTAMGLSREPKRAASGKPLVIVHLAGETDGEVQKCVRCAAVLWEYTENKMVCGEDTSRHWWPVGTSLGISTGNPRMTSPPDGFRPGSVEFVACGTSYGFPEHPEAL